MIRATLLTAILIVIVITTGCGGANTAALSLDRDSPPQRLRLELYVHLADGRNAYFRLDDARTLHYGGGADARGGGSQPAGTLSDEQLATLWRTIVDGELLTARGSFFGEPQRVRFRGSLSTSHGNNHLNGVDDQVPGLTTLSQLLTAYQAELRYRDVTDPIDTRLKEGATKR